MKKTILLAIWLIWVAAVAQAGWTVLPDGIRQLKQTAAENNKLILLEISRGRDCSHCTAAWKQALCDGVHDHDVEGCTPHDETYGDYPINGWAEKYGVQLAYAPYVNGDNTQTGNILFTRYRRVASMPSKYPMFVLLHVKEGADLAQEGVEALYEDQVDVIGTFAFVAGDTINGIRIASLNFSQFTAVVESFFPNAYWGSLDGSAVKELVDFPNDGTKSLTNQKFTEEQPELWYKFQGVAGMRYMFYGYASTGDIAPLAQATMTVGYEIRKADGTVLKAASASGLEILSRGFYLDATADGTYFIRLHATDVDERYKNVFRLLYHAEAIPAQGDITDPYYSQVVLGKWTMNLEGALAAAKENGKDVVVYVGAVTWCPYCMKMQRNYVETDAFKAWAAEHAYCVEIDNRRRLAAGYMNGEPYGPSLLTDDYPVTGYLARNGLTAADGMARIELNETAILESLLEPVASMSNAKPICYPTLIYIRGSDGQEVGCLTNNDGAFTPQPGSGYVVTSAFMANDGEKELFYQYATLVGEANEWRNNYEKETPATELNESVSPKAGLFIGGVDRKDWFGFTPKGTDAAQWTFTAKGRDGAAGQIAMTVYAVADDGSNGDVLCTATGDLSDGVTLAFFTYETLGTACRLCVEAVGMKELVGYDLSWREETLVNVVEFAETSVMIKQSDETLSLPVTLQNYGAVTGGVTVKAIALLPEASCLQVTPLEQTLSWTVEDIQGGVGKNLSLDMANGVLAAWDGLKTFSMKLSVESGDCLIGANEAMTVSVVSKPYLENSEIVFGQLFERMTTSTAQPIYVGLPGDLTVESAELPDWVHISISDGRLWVVAVPNGTAEAQNVPLTLKLTQGDKVLATEVLLRLPRVRPLSDVNPYAVTGKRFGGWLYKAGASVQGVQGRFEMTISEDGLAAEVSSGFGIETFTAEAWSASDDGGTVYAVMANEAGDLTLLAELTADGVLTGRLARDGVNLELTARPVDDVENVCDGTYSGYFSSANGSGLLTLSVEDGMCEWRVQFPMSSFGGTCEVWKRNGAGLAVLHGLDELGMGFGAALRLKAKDDREPEMYCVNVETGTLATIAMEESIRTYPCVGAEDVAVMATALEMNNPVFYLAVEGDDEGMILPCGIALRETLEGEKKGCLTLADSDLWQGTELTAVEGGWLEGTVTLYDIVNMVVVKAPLHLAKAVVETDCCAVDERPHAEGYCELPDGRILRTVLFSMANDHSIPDQAVMEVSGVQLPGESIGQRILAVGNDGFVYSETGVVPSGKWTVYGLGAVGEIRRASAAATVVGGTTLEIPLHVGWNVVGLPWGTAVMSETSWQVLKSLNPIVLEQESYVRATEWTAGMACWIFAEKAKTLSLDVCVDDSVEGEIAEGVWTFCYPPKAATIGWSWNGKAFELSLQKAGWFWK